MIVTVEEKLAKKYRGKKMNKFERRNRRGRFASKTPEIDREVNSNIDAISLVMEIEKFQEVETRNTAKQNELLGKVKQILKDKNIALEQAKATIKAQSGEIERLQKQVERLQALPRIHSAGTVNLGVGIGEGVKE